MFHAVACTGLKAALVYMGALCSGQLLLHYTMQVKIMEGWQSLEHPSLGKSAAVLCLAERLKEVILVFVHYNLNYFQDKIQRYLQSSGEKKNHKKTHQLFC